MLAMTPRFPINTIVWQSCDLAKTLAVEEKCFSLIGFLNILERDRFGGYEPGLTLVGDTIERWEARPLFE